jgi:hypothetical protein
MLANQRVHSALFADSPRFRPPADWGSLPIITSPNPTQRDTSIRTGFASALAPLPQHRQGSFAV